VGGLSQEPDAAVVDLLNAEDVESLWAYVMAGERK
jgi:hypothetical protein